MPTKVPLYLQEVSTSLVNPTLVAGPIVVRPLVSNNGAVQFILVVNVGLGEDADVSAEVCPSGGADRVLV